MPQRDCSELSQTLYELALLHAQEDGVNTVEDVVKAMQKHMPEITRQQVVDAIVEATQGHAQTRSDLAKKLDQIKREAKTDKDLRDAIAALEAELKKDGPIPADAPAPETPAKAAPTAIQALRTRKSELEGEKALRQGEGLDDLVKDLAREQIEQGERDRERILDAVHAQVSEYGLSRQDVADIISGYGEFSPLSKDEVDVAMRDLRGQLQQLAKLRDMEAGKAPLKTGQERRTPSDEERRLIKQVNEAKKKLGFVTTDPETQLKGALDAQKTRLKHEIADLEQQIRTGVKIVDTRAELVPDAELEALRAQRDALQDQYDALFPVDYEAITLGRLREEIAKVEEHIQKGTIPARPTRTPDSPAVASVREQLNALRKQMREPGQTAEKIADLEAKAKELEGHLAAGTLPTPAARPPLTPNPQVDAIRQKVADLRKAIAKSDPAVRARFESQIKKLTDRLAAGAVVPPVKVPPILSKQAERLQYERDRLRSQINEKIRGMKKQSLPGRILREIFSAPRSMITSVDVSAVLRQGGIYTLSHPVKAFRAMKPMFNAFFSDQKAHQVNNDLHDPDKNPNAVLYKRAGLYLAPLDAHDAFFAREEGYKSTLAEKVPWVKMSQRSFITFMNTIRAQAFDAMVENLARHGEPTQAELEVVANYVNVSSGRGNFKNRTFEQALDGMSLVFFSPRLLTSRFQMILGQPLYAGGLNAPRARAEIGKEYGRLLRGLVVVYMLAAMAGAEIEDDPRSSDFAKLKFGNSRIDMLAGLGQATVFLARLLTRQTKTMAGDVKPLAGDDVAYGGRTVSDVIMSFVRSKLAPVPGAAVNMLEGKNVVGEPVTVGSTAWDLLVPLGFEEIYKGFDEYGMGGGAALAGLSLLGAGVSTYEERESTSRTRTRADSRSRGRDRD